MNYDRNLHSLRISCDPMPLWYYRIANIALFIFQRSLKFKRKKIFLADFNVFGILNSYTCTIFFFIEYKHIFIEYIVYPFLYRCFWSSLKNGGYKYCQFLGFQLKMNLPKLICIICINRYMIEE